jgi:hypothetical protein
MLSTYPQTIDEFAASIPRTLPNLTRFHCSHYFSSSLCAFLEKYIKHCLIYGYRSRTASTHAYEHDLSLIKRGEQEDWLLCMARIEDDGDISDLPALSPITEEEEKAADAKAEVEEEQKLLEEEEEDDGEGLLSMYY